MLTDANWAFDAYQKIRDRLPIVSFAGVVSTYVGSLDDLASDHDVFLLDAFGVLNRGDTAIAGVPERIAGLQAMGKRLIVVTNSASYPKRVAVERFARLGFSFSPNDVISSRDALLAAVAMHPPLCWGIMASRQYEVEGLDHFDTRFLEDDPNTYHSVDGFLFLGSSSWTEKRQSLLTDSLRKNPRPLLIGNPDIVAPYETGLSREPGYFAHQIADNTDVQPIFFGKPFGSVFDMALALVRDVSADRIVMVGDTLQTDILGGRAAGIKTALVTNYGSLVGIDVERAISSSGIVPDFIMPIA
jgi:glycerol-1-phosphatase